MSDHRISDHRIYVACLASYNNGRLHGVWIDLAGKDGDDVRAEITAMLAASYQPCAQEYAVHDHEGIEEFIGSNEWPDIDELCAYVAAIEEHGEVFAAFYGLESRDSVADAVRAFDDAYQGTHDSLKDYAEELLDSTGALQEIPETLRGYFDFAAYARDMELGGDVRTADVSDRVAVFLNC